GFDAVRSAAGITTERLAGPHDFVDQNVDDVGWTVLGHRQLFKDHLALFFELLRIQQRIEQAVRQDVERRAEAMVADFGPVHGQLFVGTGVHYAANTFDLFRDFARCWPSPGALEQHVFEEVRYARDVVAFVARAGTDKDVDADGAGMWQVAADDPQAILQHGLFEHQVPAECKGLGAAHPRARSTARSHIW